MKKIFTLNPNQFIVVKDVPPRTATITHLGEGGNEVIRTEVIY